MSENKPINIKTIPGFSLFDLLSFYWIILTIIFLTLAFFDLFKKSLLVIAIVVLATIGFFLIKKKILLILPFNKEEKRVFFTIIFFSLLLSFFITPTIFGGRDEGSFSNAAIMLSKDETLTHNDSLAKTLHKLYGTGRALNFPGFNYTDSGSLKSQFLPGYIVWLGAFFNLGGLIALKIVNFIPLITLIFSFYLVNKNFLSNKIAIHSTAIFATVSPLIILNKFTLTEIFFAALIWFSLYLLLRYLKHKTYLNYWLIALPLFLAIFVRIETIAIIFTLFLVILLFDFTNLRKAKYQLPFFLLGILLFTAITFNPSFFAENIKGIAKNSVPFVFEKLNQLNQTGNQNSSALPSESDWTNFYLLKVFFNYHLLIWFLLTIVAIPYLLKKKRWSILIPFFLFSPTLIYLLDANISLDHPWMLRRFIFSLIPLSIFYGMFILDKIKYKKIYSAIIVFILFTNLWQSIPFAFKAQNKNLLTNLNSLAKEFSNNDLVLVSQKATSSGWLLLSEPLRNISGIPAVYFFRPSDLHDLKNNYSNIYLLVNPVELDLFKEFPKQLIKEIELNNQTIPPSRDPLKKPQWQTFRTKLILYKLD